MIEGSVRVMHESQLLDIAAWRQFAPALHIEDESVFRAVQPLDLSADQARALMGEIVRDGYFQAGRVDWGIDVNAMAATARALSAAGLSPVFAYLYDEFWVPFRKLEPVFRALLGGYFMLPDFWIWNVDPRKGEAGWSPHRDKGHIALFPDRRPKSLTTWIPLSAATPLNGCMYLVPASFDPTYGTPMEDNLQFDLSAVRALPAVPGEFLIWSQAILHWGGRTSPHGRESRVSMAFEFQRADVPPFNAPPIDPARMLSFQERLKLIAKQILQYRHMYQVRPGVERIALELARG